MADMFDEVRRKDRLISGERMRQVLAGGEYGFLALCGANGYGYGIPMSYAADGDKIYFHCAPEGFKLRSITENDRVSFCVVGRTNVIPSGFTTEYESVVLFGRISVVEDDREKRQALDMLVDKYSPDFKESADKYIRGSFGRTNVLRLDVEHISGKGKTLPPKEVG